MPDLRRLPREIDYWRPSPQAARKILEPLGAEEEKRQEKSGKEKSSLILPVAHLARRDDMDINKPCPRIVNV
jgi:hypothetical protein